jgi:caffeoyl-CoA O-methyltransferase
MSDNPKSFNLSPELHRYMLAHWTAPDAIQQGLIEATSKLGGVSVMQIAPEQGALMTMLTQLIGATRAIEVGTFTGYSALCIARGLPKDGQLICCDVSDEWTSVGVPFWEKAGVRAFNEKIAKDPRVDCVILAISDGLTFLRVL